MLRRLDDLGDVSLDTETSGLDFKRNHIVGYVTAFGPHPDDSYYLPVRHLGNANLGGMAGPSTPKGWTGERHKGEDALLAALSDPRLNLFGHNFGFDLRFMAKTGWKFGPRCEDTIVNAALLDEFQNGFDLENCAYLARVGAKKTELIIKYLTEKFGLSPKEQSDAMGHFWRLPGDDPIAHEYAAGDGTTTWQLRDWQHGKLAAEGLQRVHKVECRLVPILARMSVKGVKIDVEQLGRLRAQIDATIDQLLSALPRDFNARAPSQVQKFLTDHDVANWPMTPPSKRFPKGQPSFPEEWLIKSPAGKQIVKLRHYLTLRSTFTGPLASEHMFKGRVHTTFNQLRGDEYGATTGRLSSNGPNLQAIPKRDKEIGKLYRAVFVPDEGMEWFSADYSQLEPRLLAYYSRCGLMLEGYRASPPIDAHTTVTRAANLLTPEGKPDRDMGKRCNMLIINGGGAGAMVTKFGMERGHALKVLNDYFTAAPEIKNLQKKSERLFGQRGYIKTLLERKLRLRRRDIAFMSLNRILQGGNADVIKLKMCEVDDYLASENYPIELLLTIHDSLDGQLFPANEKHIAEVIRIMENFGPGQEITLDIPIVVNYDLGENWGDATFEDD